MKFSVLDLPKKITGEIPCLVSIVGTEDFLRRESLRHIQEKLHGGPPPPEDLTRLSGSDKPSEDDLTRLFDELRTPSLFGGCRSVVVDKAEAYLALDADAWAALLKKPWSGATLILILDSVDGRTKVAKALNKTGWLVEVAKPFHRPPPWKPRARPWEHDLNRWIVQRARAAGYTLDPPTAHLLQSRLGTDLGELASGLDRITTFLEGKNERTISQDVVEEHTPGGEESQIFELVDVFFLGDRTRTLGLVRSLLHRGSVDSRGQRVTDPSSLLLQFVGAALRRVRQIREVHRTLNEGGDENAIMRNAGIAKPFLPRVRQQVDATPPDTLETIIDELRRADYDLKAGRGPRADEILERLAVAGRSGTAYQGVLAF